MLRKLSFILSVLFILFFQTQSFALNRVIPCKLAQCEDSVLLRKAALKNTEDLTNQISIVYFFNIDTETSQFFRVFREQDLELGGLDIVRIRGPFSTDAETNEHLRVVYEIESKFWNLIGNSTPPPSSTLVNNDGWAVGIGYNSGSLGFSNSTSLFTLGIGSNFGSSSWVSVLSTNILIGMANNAGISVPQLQTQLSNAVNQQIEETSSLNQVEIESGANIGSIGVDGSYQHQGGSSSSFTRNNLPPYFGVRFDDGIVEFKYNPATRQFEIKKIIDKEGNIIKPNSDGTIGIESLPLDVRISPANLVTWKLLASKFALFRIKLIVDDMEQRLAECGNCHVDIVRVRISKNKT